MADNEAKLDITADDKVARAAIDRLTKQVAGLEEQLRKLHETGKKGAEASTVALSKEADEIERMIKGVDGWKREVDAMTKGVNDVTPKLKEHAAHHSQISHWLSEQGAELVKIGTGYLAVEKAVDAVVEMHSKWREKLKDIGAEQKKLTQESVKTLHGAGLLGNAEAEQFIFHGKEGTQQQRLAALEGISGGAPRADFTTQKELAEEVVKAAPLGIDLKQRGELSGRLHEIDEGKSANDIADLATVLTQKAGKRAGELQDPAFLRTVRKLKTGGLSTEQALGIGLTALQDDEQLKKFGTLGELLEKAPGDFAPKGGGHHRLTPEERRAQEFGQLDAAGRIAALQKDESLAAQLGVFAFNKLPKSQIDEMTKALTQGEATDIADQQISKLGTTPLGRARLRQERTEQRKAETLALHGERQELIADLREQIYEGAAQRGGVTFGVETARQAADWIPGSNSNEAIEYRANVAAGQGLISKEDAAEFIRALRENTEATRRNTSASPPPRAVHVNGQNEGGV